MGHYASEMDPRWDENIDYQHGLLQRGYSEHGSMSEELRCNHCGAVVTSMDAHDRYCPARALRRPEYLDMDQLTTLLDWHRQAEVRRILRDHGQLFRTAPGSSNNHQAWPGGYWDHVVETMNLVVALYEPLRARRNLPFTRQSALFVMFLHDLEKPWRYSLDDSGELLVRADLVKKSERKAFRDEQLAKYGIKLSADEANALQYVEGELDGYTPGERVQGPLAAFCHACDNLSARLWFDYPLESDDSWLGARRITESESYCGD
jgi:hypothetical protein